MDYLLQKMQTSSGLNYNHDFWHKYENPENRSDVLETFYLLCKQDKSEQLKWFPISRSNANEKS